MRKVLIFVSAVLLLGAVAYAQTNQLCVGTFCINAGAARTVNSDDLLTTQQGDARYARVGATPVPTPTPGPTPAPTPVGPPQYFGTLTLTNGVGTVTFSTIVQGCRVSARSGINPRYSVSGATWTFNGAPTDLVDFECR